MIIKCGCKNGPNGVKNAAEFQDATYGEGNRVHTPMVKDNPKMFRCTICSTERSKPGAGEAAKGKKEKELAKTKS